MYDGISCGKPEYHLHKCVFVTQRKATGWTRFVFQFNVNEKTLERAQL